MSKHTPGPWKAIKTTESTYYDDQVQIGHDRVGVYSEADAYLISAAPEMLDALRMAEERLVAIHEFTSQSSRGTLAVIRAAMAKATGEQP